MLFNPEQYQKEPLFISDFQKSLSSLPKNQRQTIFLRLLLDANNGCRYLAFDMLSGDALKQYPELAERYLLGMMNNFVSCFGGERLELYYPTNNTLLNEICRHSIESFDVDSPINNRTAYGVYVNYINRMNPHLHLKPFAIQCYDIAQWREPSKSQIVKLYEPSGGEKERELLRLAATTLDNKCFCSLDVGGNSIKGAVVKDGEIAFLKEHCWYPSGCKTAEELLAPMLLMLRLLRCCAALDSDSGELIHNALNANLSCVDLRQAVETMEKLDRDRLNHFAFDAITIGFPDIVVHNKIAGGETFKQKGMRANFSDCYDSEFAKTVDLDEMAHAFVKPHGGVVVMNDGNAASFITSVEQAFLQESIIDANGMFINTIGTEMGTGFVSRGGTIQYFPLEGYQQVIDLGNTIFSQYATDDVRSLNSRSTGIPGTVQKYITQLGLFRLAVTGLIEKAPSDFSKLVQEGLLTYDAEKDHLTVPVEPIDRRGDLTRVLIDMLEQGHPVLIHAFRTIGKAMGIHIDQGRLIFPEIRSTRLLSGGIIASDCAFREMLAGLFQYNPEYMLIRLDENMMLSPLLKKMQPHQRNFNVAIGSAYIGNYRLIANHSKC